MDNSIQTNIPSTDESTIECNGDYTNTNCIIHEEAISILSLPANSSLTKVVENLLLALVDTKNRLSIAENNITQLQNP